LDDQEVDLPGYQILHGRPGAAVRDELNPSPRRLLKENAGHLRCRVLVHERRLAGVRFHPGDQPVEVICREGLLADQQLRIDGYQPDRLEILLQIVGQPIDHAADVSVPLSDIDRVTVGRGARDAADGNAAARTADVFDDHRLTEHRPHSFRHDACNYVRRSTWREGDDERDRAGRVGLWLSNRDAGEYRQRDRNDKISHARPLEQSPMVM
jgi:hypothetical protein